MDGPDIDLPQGLLALQNIQVGITPDVIKIWGKDVHNEIMHGALVGPVSSGSRKFNVEAFLIQVFL